MGLAGHARTTIAIVAAYQTWRNGMHLTGPGLPTQVTALAALAPLTPTPAAHESQHVTSIN